MPEASVAIIGGSGFYSLEGLSDVEEIRLSTPFGEPSDIIQIGTFAGQRIAFQARHGRGHYLLPSEVPARANIYALKCLGVERIFAVSAVGSLQKEIEPLHFVVPHQIIDRTSGRPGTFFGNGLVAHVSLAQPICPMLSGLLHQAGNDSNSPVHEGGSYLVINGPAFSTKSESQIYRGLGATIIGMTAMPEAKLAREAEICYAILACVTDYDCWLDDHESVTADAVVNNLAKAVDSAKRLIADAIELLPQKRSCMCSGALKHALVTPLRETQEGLRKRLEPIIGKYLKAGGMV